MKKDLAIIFGLFLFISALLVFGKNFSTGSFLRQIATPSGQVQPVKDKVTVTIKALTIDALVAQKQEERKVGLAKRDSLPLDSGMLFVFENSGKYAI